MTYDRGAQDRIVVVLIAAHKHVLAPFFIDLVVDYMWKGDGIRRMYRLDRLEVEIQTRKTAAVILRTAPVAAIYQSRRIDEHQNRMRLELGDLRTRCVEIGQHASRVAG